MPRVTHVVLVDGLPVRSWVEDEGWDRGDDLWDDRWRDPLPFPDPYDAPRPRIRSVPLQEREWDALCVEVGGETALLALDEEPLPAEEVDWGRVPGPAHWAVGEVLLQVDRALERWPDEEVRTACRRFVVDAAERDGLAFGAYDVARTAAATYWAVGRAGFVIGPELRATNAAVLQHFGLHTSPEAHAARLLGPVVRFGPHGHVSYRSSVGRLSRRPGQGFDLGDPRLLLSGRRAVLVAERDRLLPFVTPQRPTAVDAGRTSAQDEMPEWERAIRLLTDGPQDEVDAR